jgi:hypothetical protein
MCYVKVRILRQSKANEYRIIDRKVVDDDGSYDSKDRRIFSDPSQYVIFKSTVFTSEQGERVQNHRQQLG